MMSRKTFALIVGYFSIIWHMFLMLTLFGVTSLMDDAFEKTKTVEEFNKSQRSYLNLLHEYVDGMLAIGIFACLAMFIVAILLVIGIKKNRHTYVLPFVVVMTFSMVYYIMHIFLGVDVDEDDKTDHKDLAEIFTCLIYAAIWYPIYKMYNKMRYENKHPASAPVSPPVNPHYPAYAVQTKTNPACPEPLPEFSHSAKYVHTETKVPTQEYIYPTVSKV